MCNIFSMQLLLTQFLLSLPLIFLPIFTQAAPHLGGPEAGGRSNASNYKDMVLADCIATAYQSAPKIAEDAGSSAGALVDWTLFDAEKAPPEIRALVKNYLARDYQNPLAESERPGIQFSLLKCFDLYHSKALAKQVKRYVGKPNRSFRQDHPVR